MEGRIFVHARRPATMSDALGIVYVATGDEFVEEATVSARSVRAHMDVPITLFADRHVDSTVFDETRTIRTPRYSFGDQVTHLGESPYEKTLFLDTDIYLDESIAGVFDLLDRFDVCAAHNGANHASDRIDLPRVNSLPDCFPEYNTGLIGYRSNNRVDALFSDWRSTYERVLERGQELNQAAFRAALFESDVKVATLPPEYNCILWRSGRVAAPVKAFHGRLTDVDGPGAGKHVDVERAAETINSRDGPRLFTPFRGRIVLLRPPLPKRILYSLEQRGLVGTVRKGIGKVRSSL